MGYYSRGCDLKDQTRVSEKGNQIGLLFFLRLRWMQPPTCIPPVSAIDFYTTDIGSLLGGCFVDLLWGQLPGLLPKGLHRGGVILQLRGVH